VFKLKKPFIQLGEVCLLQFVKQENYLLFDGIHEAIIDEDLWEKAQEKRKVQAKRYEHINKGKNEKIHLLSGLLCCPMCDTGMYGNKSIKKKNWIVL
jgi:Recombinase.